MRLTNRIPFVLDKLEIQGELRNKIQKKWEEEHDQRLFQLLENYFTKDEYEFMVNQCINICGFRPNWNTECIGDILTGEEMLWTSVLDKDKNLLDEPITRQLKDLETEHIIAIINEMPISEKYMNTFIQILNKRGIEFTDEEINKYKETQKTKRLELEKQRMIDFANLLDNV